MVIFVGTYTERMPHVEGVAEGILVGDYCDGVIAALHTVPARNPSWLVSSPTHVYAVVEAGDGDEGFVVVFARSSASLRLIQTVHSGGREPAHLALDPTGRFLVAANYADGVVSAFALALDGHIAQTTDLVRLEGSSVDPIRQTGAHPHHVLFDPATGGLLVTDLGIDALIGYELGTDGKLTERDRTRLPPGSGPRHATFHPDGEHLLVLNELANTIAVFRRDGAGFRLRSLASTLPAETSALSYASALAITATGDTVYASNRGHDTVAVFTWNAAQSILKPVQFEPTRGRTPRAFTLSPDERFLLVGNQDSDSVVTFERTGRGLLQFRASMHVPTPVCLVIAAEVKEPAGELDADLAVVVDGVAARQRPGSSGGVGAAFGMSW